MKKQDGMGRGVGNVRKGNGGEGRERVNEERERKGVAPDLARSANAHLFGLCCDRVYTPPQHSVGCTFNSN